MTYVVTEGCIRCKYTDCAAVCPVDCFYEGDIMLVINPDECIDCAACASECPVDAIVPDSDPLADDWIPLNAKYAARWPNIVGKGTPLPDADVHRDEANKFEMYFQKSSAEEQIE